jgi:hypothetical protein
MKDTKTITKMEHYPCLCCGEERCCVSLDNGENIMLRADKVRRFAVGDIVDGYTGDGLVYVGRDEA